MLTKEQIERKYNDANDFIKSKNDEVTLDHDVSEAYSVVKILGEVLQIKK